MRTTGSEPGTVNGTAYVGDWDASDLFKDRFSPRPGRSRTAAADEKRGAAVHAKPLELLDDQASRVRQPRTAHRNVRENDAEHSGSTCENTLEVPASLSMMSQHISASITNPAGLVLPLQDREDLSPVGNLNG